MASECVVCPARGLLAVVEAAKPEPLAWMRLEPTWRRMSTHVVPVASITMILTVTVIETP